MRAFNAGKEINWGEVTAFQPGSHFAMRFWMGFPREQGGDGAVRFEPLGAGRCRVTLSHSGLEERFGADAMATRGRFVVGSADVFETGFAQYAGV